MPTKLIKPAEHGYGMFNAVYGGQYSSEYAYINGYYEGAKTLISSALGNGAQDLLIYPILYICRHLVELHLKTLIHEVDKLRTIRFNLKEDGIQPKLVDEKTLNTTHSIKVLFDIFYKNLSSVSVEKFDIKVKNALLDLHNSDDNGQAYRYNQKVDKSKSIPNVMYCDLNNFGDILNSIHFYLLGVNMWVGNECEMRLLASRVR